MEENNIKTALENLIHELDNPNYRKNKLVKRNYIWYRNATDRNRILWYIFQVLAFLTSFSTSILIALTKESYLQDESWKVFLIIISGLSTASISVVGLFKIFELWKVRDEGRYMFNLLLNDSLKAYNLCSKNEEYAQLYSQIIEKVKTVEEQQSKSYLGLFGEKGKTTNSIG